MADECDKSKGDQIQDKSTAEEDNVECKLENAGIIVPPDGGYGWVVVAASFLANVLVDGIIFTTGQSLLGIWEKDFQTTAMAASWAQSLLGGCYLIAGPLAGAFANHFGCRIVTITGALLAFTGFVLSALVPALPILYLTFGIVGGIGFGLIYLPAIVIVSQYFDKRRALATGLAVCGSGIGTTLFSQINPFLLNLHKNNWRFFLVNIAFIILLNIVCGICFKALKPNETQVEKVAEIASEYHERQKEFREHIMGAGKEEEERRKSFTPKSETTKSPRVTEGVAIERFGSATHLNGPRFAPARPFLSNIELHASRRSDKDVWSQRDVTRLISKESVTEINKPLSKMDIFYPGSTSNIAQRTAHLGGQRRTQSVELRGGHYLSVHELSTKEKENIISTDDDWKVGVRAALGSMLDTSLLKSPSFIILAASGFLTLSCFFVPFIYLGAQASQNGVTPSQQASLLTALGVINIIARVLCGFVSDLPAVDPLLVSNLAVICGGAATFLVPFLTEFWMYLVYTVPFAFGVACFASLRSVICVELLGIEKLSNAYGMLLLFMGIAALVGPPFAAVLKDLTGNYDLSFYVMGSLMALSGIICLPLRKVSAFEEKRRNKAEDAKDDAELQKLEPAS